MPFPGGKGNRERVVIVNNTDDIGSDFKGFSFLYKKIRINNMAGWGLDVGFSPLNAQSQSGFEGLFQIHIARLPAGAFCV